MLTPMRVTAVAAATAVLLTAVAGAQQRPAAIEVLPVRGQVYLLASAAGLVLTYWSLGLQEGILSMSLQIDWRVLAFTLAIAAMTAVAFGIGPAIATTRVLESLLFGVGALDVPTFVVMSAVMLAVALLASYVPAARASRLDPMRLLRAE